MEPYHRTLQKLVEKQLYKEKVIIIYGARRTGKTTLCKTILANAAEKGKKTKYLNCELLSVNQELSTSNEIVLKNYLGNLDLVVLDEAQHIENIGLVLKILVDTYPEIQVIATGSSSFDLANKTGEPLTGRARKFILYPLSIQELHSQYDQFQLNSYLDKILRFGLYPSVFQASEEDAPMELEEIASNYLYKDILSFEKVKSSETLSQLLQLLALQLGNEVSYNEIGTQLGLDSATVKRYIDLLEKCFVVFKLRSLNRNPRNEIKKGRKIYFYDLGIRNSLIRNYNHLKLRNDEGALWENFCIIERMKYNQTQNRLVNSYFWRNINKQEVDYIEEADGEMKGFEFKFSPHTKMRSTKTFLENYTPSTIQRVDQSNYLSFLM
ncbi:MAG: ATP-binding protein [Alphaproteobacteria bacterium]